VLKQEGRNMKGYVDSFSCHYFFLRCISAPASTYFVFLFLPSLFFLMYLAICQMDLFVSFLIIFSFWDAAGKLEDTT